MLPKAIKFFEIDELSNLPLVFGDHKSFSDFYKILKKVNFPLSEIKKNLRLLVYIS